VFSQRSEQLSVLSFGLSLHLYVGLRALAIEITCRSVPRLFSNVRLVFPT